MTERARSHAYNGREETDGHGITRRPATGAVSFLVRVNYHILMHSSTARLHPYICIYSPTVYQSLCTRGHLECGALLYWYNKNRARATGAGTNKWDAEVPIADGWPVNHRLSIGLINASRYINSLRPSRVRCTRTSFASINVPIPSRGTKRPGNRGVSIVTCSLGQLMRLVFAVYIEERNLAIKKFQRV